MCRVLAQKVDRDGVVIAQLAISYEDLKKADKKSPMSDFYGRLKLASAPQEHKTEVEGRVSSVLTFGANNIYCPAVALLAKSQRVSTLEELAGIMALLKAPVGWSITGRDALVIMVALWKCSYGAQNRQAEEPELTSSEYLPRLKIEIRPSEEVVGFRTVAMTATLDVGKRLLANARYLNERVLKRYNLNIFVDRGFLDLTEHDSASPDSAVEMPVEEPELVGVYGV
ncbi:MAG TPA: hypothetical protein VMQ44_02110 [Candidatus Saccharimonadales bacterium]|nr:hypothetical protein [Candidatus Saccharimonadales bacterium]